jgi:hypothetical protein
MSVPGAVCDTGAGPFAAVHDAESLDSGGYPRRTVPLEMWTCAPDTRVQTLNGLPGGAESPWW